LIAVDGAIIFISSGFRPIIWTFVIRTFGLNIGAYIIPIIVQS